MEKISEKEMLKIMGGYDKEGCDKVVEEGNAHSKNDQDYDWDAWLDEFEAHCQ